ncbi:MAG: SipW-dependent-type signal peptide-containing protein [Candidatus Borkfalkiaceae bacterium]|nr:SipW-dependent-type signal peptide-containing protein [Christensenellaceae bacterium]
MKTVSTKKTFIASVFAMLLCLSLLVGSTFAWFTDSASTSVNTIKAGNLKVELLGADGASPLGDSLKWVKADGAAANEEVLWEPGCTYNLEGFRIKNAGNLALKYKVFINGLTGSAKLLSAIDFTVKMGDEVVALEGFENKLAANAVTDVITISGTMKTDAGNDYMNEKIENISITVVATQDTVESDSNGNTYDENAVYPVFASATVKADEDTVLKDKQEDHAVKVTAPVGSVADGAELNLTVVETAVPATITVATEQTSQSYEVTLKDADDHEVTAQSGLFEVELQIGKNLSGVQMYHDGAAMTNDGTTLTDAADHYVYSSATGYVTMKVSHFSPFTAVYAKPAWGDSVAEDYATPVDENAKVVTIASAEELALLAQQVNGGKNYNGYTVKLANDIDIGEYQWVPIGNSDAKFQGVFDGQGYTISNLIIDQSGQCDVGLFGFTTNGEIKNFTLKNAHVKGYLDVGAVAGTPYTSKYSNISLTGDVEISGYAYVGGMFGKNAYANLTDLTIDVNEGSYVKADSKNYRTYVGGLVGFMGEGNQTVKNVTSNINVTGSTCDVGGITGIAHYDNTFINCHSSGDVTLEKAQDAGDELEIGGIAGVWHNGQGTVTLSGCTYSGKLSSTNVTTGAVAEDGFCYNGLVGNKYNRGSESGNLIIE